MNLKNPHYLHNLRPIIFRMVILITVIINGLSVYADNLDKVDIDAPFIVIKSRKIDQPAVDTIVNEKIRSLQDSLAEITRAQKVVKSALPNVGKKCPSECQSFLSYYANQLKSEGLKDADKIVKDMDKGKINKKFTPYLEGLLSTLEGTQYLMQNQLDRILRDGADAVFKSQAMPTLEYNDTVANPYSRYAMYVSDDSYQRDKIFNHDHAKMVEGWEWLRQDHDVQYVNKKYPIEVSYRVYPAHPEYAVRQSDYGFAYFVYDESGNLKYVYPSNEISRWIGIYPEGKLRNQILKHAYDTNAYDIQAEGNLVRHKIMVSIGLEKKTAKEKQLEDKAYNKVMGFLGAAEKWNRAKARHGAESRSARAAMSEVGKALYSTGKPTAAEKSDGEAGATASSWEDQIIMEDLRDVFTKPWKIERLSPTKFRMTFVDDEGVPTYQYELEYINDKAFHCITEENMIFPDKDNSVFDEFIKYKDSPINQSLTDSDKSVRADSGTSADWEIYTAVEQQAEFPGGHAAMMKWISHNIIYPKIAQENNIQGRVAVKFVVEKDGSLTGIEIVKSVDGSLDAEAIRLINKMPQWLPAQNGNTPVRSYYTLPITFKR